MTPGVKKKFGSYFITYTVINSKWILDLNMKKGNHNCIRRHHGRIIFNLGVEKTQVWHKTQKGLKKRILIKLHKNKKHVHEKNHHRQSQKTNEKLWENICNSYIRKGLISIIYNKLIQINKKKIINPIYKWAEN